MTAPLSPERLAKLRESRYRARSLAAADVDIDDLLAEVTRLSPLELLLVAAEGCGHDSISVSTLRDAIGGAA